MDELINEGRNPHEESYHKSKAAMKPELTEADRKAIDEAMNSFVDNTATGNPTAMKIGYKAGGKWGILHARAEHEKECHEIYAAESYYKMRIAELEAQCKELKSGNDAMCAREIQDKIRIKELEAEVARLKGSENRYKQLVALANSSVQSPEDIGLKDWLERAFEAGSNHFAYRESNRSEYSPDFQEWYEHYKGHLKSPSLVNDELLAAIKDVMVDPYFGQIFYSSQDRLKAAVAKAEQSKPEEPLDEMSHIK